MAVSNDDEDTIAANDEDKATTVPGVGLWCVRVTVVQRGGGEVPWRREGRQWWERRAAWPTHCRRSQCESWLSIQACREKVEVERCYGARGHGW